MGLRVLEQPDAVLGGSVDVAQGDGEVRRLRLVGGVAGREPGRGAPRPDGQRELAGDRAHEPLEALLLDRLAGDQRVLRAEEQGEVAGWNVQVAKV